VKLPQSAFDPRLSRRGLLVLGAGAFVAALPFARGASRLVRRRFPVMGTVAEIAVVERDARRAHVAIDAAAEALRRADAQLSRFRADSDVGRANRLAARDGVEISPDAARVLEAALGWAEASDGAFDPCLGRAIELWDVTRRHEPPPAAAVTALAGRRLHGHLDLDLRPGRSRVRFTDPDVRIDLGGIGVGFGVDRAVDALRARGIAHALVNVGGDLYALGRSEDGDAWRVGVERAEAPGRVGETLAVADAAVTTSGDTFQFFEHGGRRYHHILDPRTGEPRRTAMHSVTVMAETCIQADAAATAVFGMAAAAAERLLRARAPGARRVAVG
jgi:thiamine biosynthesis lipoprotein